MDSERRDRITKGLMEAILLAIQDNGQRIFDQSQRQVPTKSGQLKGSGNFERSSKGWVIQYTSSYAKDVEFGEPAQDIIGTFTYQVPGYIRTGYKRKDGAYVPPSRIRPHKVELTDQRPVAIRTSNGIIFRTLSKWRARTGRFFLTKSINDGLKKLPEDLKRRVVLIRL